MVSFDCLLKIRLLNIKQSILDRIIPDRLVNSISKFITNEFRNLDSETTKIDRKRAREYNNDLAPHLIINIRNVNDREISALIEGLYTRFGMIFDDIELLKF